MKNPLLSRSAILCFSLLALNACKSTSNTNSSSETESDMSADQPNVPLSDPNFCVGTAPGGCFTLALLVPKNDYLSDLGLSIISMAGDSAKMAPLLDQACRDASAKFWLAHAKPRGIFPKPLRSSFVRKVKKMRCVLKTLDSGAQESWKPTLHPNELAMTVRLTQFDIEGSEQKVNANTLRFQQKKTLAQLQYRSVEISAGSAVSSAAATTWSMLPKLGFESHKVQGSFDRDISVNVNWDAFRRNLNSIDLSKDPGEQTQALVAFFKNARRATTAADPAGAALVLLGMGYEAFNFICGDGKARDPADETLCSYARTTVNINGDISKDLNLGTSNGYEVFRSAIINSVSAALDDIFEKGDAQIIRSVYAL